MKSLRQHLAEWLTAAVMLAGWAALTAGAAAFFPAKAHAIWSVSVGLLCLSLAGWRFTYQVIRDGLYVLTRTGRS